MQHINTTIGLIGTDRLRLFDFKRDTEGIGYRIQRSPLIFLLTGRGCIFECLPHFKITVHYACNIKYANSTEMLEDFFNPATNGDHVNEDGTELVVTALGTSGTHYICWKTGRGEYKQRSHGLPTQLQEWLFPPDGTTRDFDTLQVILLGDDAFWASDKNGEIRNDSPIALKQLRRAITFHDGAPSPTRERRLSRGRDLEQNLERPRASTLPATLSRENAAARKQLRPLLSHSRTPSLDKYRLGPAVPVSVRRQGRISPIRPRSIDTTLHGELGVLKEQPTPRPNAPLLNASDSRHNVTSYHSHGYQEESAVRQTQPTPNQYHRPNYADASVQTEPEPDNGPQECTCQLRDYGSQRDMTVPLELISKSSRSFTNSQRSSVDTAITRPDSGFFESSWTPPLAVDANPVVMGRMQDYFRSTTYVLGAALHPQGMG
ncbi:hypothetical protein O1611_g7307 [Lasiodiplodia mahajangana]|uniref:Uncharacterized protein n=1 Tax=Lasiodiplodia mahajangana TaxID=1108764 RepID=A0ACC2JFS8_9PEZI|nr:hypothetical protein O1611_g7307 [Lasiodiplodia mahajangana]